METGISQEQIEAAKRLFRQTASDRVQLRFVLSVLILLVGYLAVVSPLSNRLAAARKAKAKALKKEAMAEAVVHYTDQIEAYTPLLVSSADVVEWEQYVMAKMDAAGVTLHSLEPRKSSAKSVYQMVEMEVVARGPEYAPFVDLIDRLEHGERLVRIEKVLFERQPHDLILTCTLKGLVKPSLTGGGAEEGPGV